MKFIVYLLIALCLFVHPSLALALSTPTYNEAVLNKGKTPPGAKTVAPQVAGIAEWGYTRKFQNDVQSVLEGISSESYQVNQTIKTPNFGPESLIFEKAALNLLPKSVQDNFLRLISYDQHMTANHTQCFYDENNPYDHHPDENIFKEVAYYLSPIRNASWALYPIMSVGSLAMKLFNFFELLPDEKVTPQNGLKCGTQDEGTDEPFKDGNAGKQEYIANAHPEAKWTAEEFCPNEVEKWRECMQENQGLKKDDPNWQDCSLVCRGNAHTVYSTNIPGSNTPGDFTEKLGYLDPNKKQGIVYTSYPRDFSFNKKHGKTEQCHTLKLMIFSDDVCSEESIFDHYANIKEHISAYLCSLTPKQLQDPKHPCPTPQPPVALAGLRNEQDAVETREPAQCSEKVPLKGSKVSKNGLDAAIKNAATLEHVQECVLQGIAYIEGADQEMEQSSCIPNQCGAAGPFQISVGVDSCGNKTCDQCGPNWKGRKCNDETWALEAVGGTAASACDVTIAARAAARIFLGKANGLGQTYSISNSQTLNKNAIILGADAYYGVTSPIERLGGLSYGEFVYSKCDPSYTKHVDHQFQTPTTGRPI